jgi:GMP synthase (glutamine-hydrolysing)
MKLLVIDNADYEDRDFNAPLFDAIPTTVDFDILRYSDIALDGSPDTGYSGVILSGVPLHYPLETIAVRRRYIDWIRESLSPTLGICIGHQSLGLLFGASTIQNTEAEDGECEITTLKDDRILRGIPRQFNARLIHTCSITLPPNFTLLASSSRCRNQIMKHNEKDLYGLQFHPELSDIGAILLQNFIDIARQTK